jgi:uncharacterized protein
MLALYTSDLHGEPDLYRQLFELIDREAPNAVILGGDLSPTRFGPDGPPIQREFFVRLLAQFDAHSAAGRRFYFIFGNADCGANWDWIVSQARPHAVPLHGRVERLGDGLDIAGYSFVPVTPLALKDWEKRDSRETGGERWEGIRTHEGGATRVDLRRDPPEETLARDFDRLSATLEGRRAICVLHSPPSDTHLDCIGPGHHVGSLAARHFLARVQPPLALHGHIHESPEITGHYTDQVGETLCVNPGQALHGPLHAVLFDPEHVRKTLRHTVFGALGQ